MTRKELMPLMPETASDHRAARRVVELGFPAVAPVLRDMLIWLRVSDSKVADVFEKFFAMLSPPPTEMIAKQLGKNAGAITHRILVNILPSWPEEAIKKLGREICVAATRPDAWNNDVECFRLILKHGLGDEKWVKSWIRARKNDAQKRVGLLQELEAGNNQ